MSVRKIKFEVGKIYHIFNRGVEKRSIFKEERDMWRFLQGMFLFNDEKSSQGVLYEIEKTNQGNINFKLLKEFVDDNQEERKPLVKIMADCLMPNHYHLLVQEIRENGITMFMHKLGTGYVSYFNQKYNRVGGLFQGRFRAVEIKDDIQLQYILAYINIINPGQLIEPELKENGVMDVEKVFNFAKNYSFSTNPDYLGLRDSIIIDKGIYKEIFSTPKKYEEAMRNTLLSKRYNLINELLFD